MTRKASAPVIPGVPALPDTKATKAWVSLVVTLAGLVGVNLTTGTAQVVVILVWVVLSWFGVWRARNHPRRQGVEVGP